jgi:hypothetical protein
LLKGTKWKRFGSWHFDKATDTWHSNRSIIRDASWGEFKARRVAELSNPHCWGNECSGAYPDSWDSWDRYNYGRYDGRGYGRYDDHDGRIADIGAMDDYDDVGPDADFTWPSVQPLPKAKKRRSAR